MQRSSTPEAGAARCCSPRSPHRWGTVRALWVFRHIVTSKVGRRMMRTPADYPLNWLQEKAHFKGHHWPLNSIVLNYMRVPIRSLFFHKHLCCFPSAVSRRMQRTDCTRGPTSCILVSVLRGSPDLILCPLQEDFRLWGVKITSRHSTSQGWAPLASPQHWSTVNWTLTWKTSREEFSKSHKCSPECQCTIVII